jgi:pyruvate formate lyase activating enzyme
MQTRVYHISFHTAHNLCCLFFWGCNFECVGCLRKVEPFDCHFPAPRQSPKPFSPTFLTLDEITDALSGVKPEFVVFEGWEPTLDPNLSEIAGELHRQIGTCNYLLTNGYIFRDVEDIDEVKVSIKALSDDIHREYTGKSNRRVLQNLGKLHQSGIKLSAETVLIPGYVDEEEIGRIARFLASVDREIPLRIDAYWPIASKKWRVPSAREMRKAVHEAERYLANVSFLEGTEEVQGEVVALV